MKKNYIKAEDLDSKFEDGEDISQYLDLRRAQRSGLDQRRISVDFPSWMVWELDREVKRLGVTRQSIIKFWISERLGISEI